MKYCLMLTALIAAAISSSSHAATALTTIAEQSGFQKTGRYEEAIKLCKGFQRHYPKAVRCTTFGTTPEGRPMLAIIASRTGALTARTAHQRKLPVLLVQGGIHAGEIDGKDAGFLTLREALDNTAAKGALDKQVLVFVPVFNIDGHERFGRWNRPNQRGPEEMGWRTTAQNFNLNRDYVKADAPEMQAMLRLINEWDPLATIDLHVTDGAKFEHDISIQVEPAHTGDDGLQKAGKLMRDAVIADLAKQGSLPLPFYMSFKEEDNPQSGFVDGVPPPRFSTGYFPLRNRFGMLVETHSWKDYATRVRITRNTVISVLDQIAAHGIAWRQMAIAADARAAQLAGKPLAVTYKASDKTTQIDFRGYAYSRTMSDISGALMTHYDETTPQLWHVPLRDEVVPDTSVTAPLSGYIVPAAQALAVGEKLRQHGIIFHVINKAPGLVNVEIFRATKANFNAQSTEGHQMIKLDGEWLQEPRQITQGALYVPIAQAKARLVIALFEPRAPDALVNWGWFNNFFERKEYMEAYVAEEVAREQLAADPVLKIAFEMKLASEPEFANNPEARLAYFARRHTSWDERYQLYPVMRTAVKMAK
ncbi:MAG: M14 family metallopeptidase [Undibacterium sp.]|nr:M14 family metallopeptidase [Undibacterium sp.]